MHNPGKRVASTVKCLSYKIHYDRTFLLAYYTYRNRDAHPACTLTVRLPSIESNGPQEFNFFENWTERDMCALWLTAREVTLGV